MFGWEFPPHIAGGLGTACLGMTRGLLHQGVEVSFVLPKLFGGEEGDRMRMLSAEDVGLTLSSQEIAHLATHLRIVGVDSFLHPYLNIQDVYSTSRDQTFGVNLAVHHWSQQKFTFSGKYGASLLDEVARYALVAASIASQESFDIIHAHDWLT